MIIPRPVCIDYETHGIRRRPKYPPQPVGVAIKYPDEPAQYYAWGHETGANPSNPAEAEHALMLAYRYAVESGHGVLCQNAKFDTDVTETFFPRVPKLPWHLIHDTMYLLFLDDPRADLSLKPSAQRILGVAPEEQDAVADWLLDHQPVPGVRISRAKNSPHYFGAYICYAPAEIVGPYAIGDVDRTAALFDRLYPEIVRLGMLDAYDRERRLMPILLQMERQGVPIDLPRLTRDVEIYVAAQKKIDKWVRAQLHVGAECNLDSGEQLMAALIAAGKVGADLARTPKSGKIATHKAALDAAITDARLSAVLRYRASLSTCMSTFMVPWLATAAFAGGLIYTSWNQVRAPRGDASVGAATGRLSSTPNFQNIPKEFADLRLPIKLPALPRIREYIIPHAGCTLIDRDYSQQELRILAHYEAGVLLAQYQDDPWIDVHDATRDTLAARGLVYERRAVKTTNFGLIYGMGVGRLASSIGQPIEDARALKQAILSLYPGLAQIYRDMRERAARGEPIRTWGGRLYYCEPPKTRDDGTLSQDYKLVNVLIQGSAADCTKEALIRYNSVRGEESSILLNVHDQITVSVPHEQVADEMEMLTCAMESVEFDVSMLSEGKTSDQSWGQLAPYDKRGKRV